VLWILIWIRIAFSRLDPDPDPGGQKLLTKIEKGKKFQCFGCSLFKAEGFSFSLDVLHVGPGKKIAFLFIFDIHFLSAVKIFYFWLLKP
jgi:hypothetical protein